MGLLNIGQKVGSKFGGMTGLALGTIGLAGMASSIGPSAKEALLDTAFDDPYADQAFMGRQMSGGFLGAAAMGGTAGAVGLSLGTTAVGAALGGGAAAKLIPKGTSSRGLMVAAATAVGGAIGMQGGPANETISVYGPKPSVGANIATTGMGAAVGGAIGGLGYGFKRGPKKALIGAGLGAAIGGLAGAAAVPAATMSRLRSNRDLLTSSPYSTSLGMAQALNASGDIVLGMHNSRNSY